MKMIEALDQDGAFAFNPPGRVVLARPCREEARAVMFQNPVVRHVALFLAVKFTLIGVLLWVYFF